MASLVALNFVHHIAEYLILGVSRGGFQIQLPIRFGSWFGIAGMVEHGQAADFMVKQLTLSAEPLYFSINYLSVMTMVTFLSSVACQVPFSCTRASAGSGEMTELAGGVAAVTASSSGRPTRILAQESIGL